MYVLLIVVCPFVLFLLAIVLPVLLRYTDSDCPFGIFKLFLLQYNRAIQQVGTHTFVQLADHRSVEKKTLSKLDKYIVSNILFNLFNVRCVFFLFCY